MRDLGQDVATHAYLLTWSRASTDEGFLFFKTSIYYSLLTRYSSLRASEHSNFSDSEILSMTITTTTTESPYVVFGYGSLIFKVRDLKGWRN